MGGMATFNLTHAHMKNCELRGAIARADFIVIKKRKKSIVG